MDRPSSARNAPATWPPQAQHPGGAPALRVSASCSDLFSTYAGPGGGSSPGTPAPVVVAAPLRRATASFGSLAPSSWASIQEFHDITSGRLGNLSISRGRPSLELDTNRGASLRESGVPPAPRPSARSPLTPTAAEQLPSDANWAASAACHTEAGGASLLCGEPNLSPITAPTPLSWQSSQESCPPAMWSPAEPPAPWGLRSNKRLYDGDDPYSKRNRTS